MRITVFGASGKIGRLTGERLLADGHEVLPTMVKVMFPQALVELGGMATASFI